MSEIPKGAVMFDTIVARANAKPSIDHTDAEMACWWAANHMTPKSELTTLRARVQELEAQVPKWVSVEDGLPRDNRLAEVYYCDEGVDVFDHDWFEDDVWQNHYSNYEHFEAVGGASAIPGEVSTGPSKTAPYTHWRYVNPPEDSSDE